MKQDIDSARRLNQRLDEIKNHSANRGFNSCSDASEYQNAQQLISGIQQIQGEESDCGSPANTDEAASLKTNDPATEWFVQWFKDIQHLAESS